MKTGMLAAETAFDAVARATRRSARCSHVRRADSTPAGSEPSCYPVQQRPPELQLRPARRAGLRRPAAGDPRLVDATAGDPGHERMQNSRMTTAWATRRSSTCSNAVEARSRADVRQADERALLGHAPRGGSAVASARAHRGLPFASAARNTAIPACGSVRRMSTRWCPTATAAAAADQRVELRALQDVRHHGSVSGHHLGAARRRRRAAVRRHVTVRAAALGTETGTSRSTVAGEARAGRGHRRPSACPLIAALGSSPDAGRSRASSI